MNFPAGPASAVGGVWVAFSGFGGGVVQTAYFGSIFKEASESTQFVLPRPEEASGDPAPEERGRRAARECPAELYGLVASVRVQIQIRRFL